MKLSNILKDLSEEEIKLTSEVERLRAELANKTHELKMIQNMLGRSKPAHSKGVYVKQIKTMDTILSVLYEMGGKGTRTEIIDKLQSKYLVSAARAAFICSNHLSTLYNKGCLSRDDSGEVRVYVYSGPEIKHDLKEQKLHKSLNR